MTFEELEESLPNGFHDATIRWIKSDFISRSLTIGMELWVGLTDSPNPEEYRTGTLLVDPFYLFFVEPPHPTYGFMPDGSPIIVDGDPVKLGQNPNVDRLLSVLPEDATAYRFFVIDGNSSLFIAGRSVAFWWDDAASVAERNQSADAALE
jgi:hypothetical protein